MAGMRNDLKLYIRQDMHLPRSFEVSLQHGLQQLITVLVGPSFTPDALVELDLYCVSEGDELARVFDFPLRRWNLDIHPLNCSGIAFSVV